MSNRSKSKKRSRSLKFGSNGGSGAGGSTFVNTGSNIPYVINLSGIQDSQIQQIQQIQQRPQIQQIQQFDTKKIMNFLKIIAMIKIIRDKDVIDVDIFNDEPTYKCLKKQINVIKDICINCTEIFLYFYFKKKNSSFDEIRKNVSISSPEEELVFDRIRKILDTKGSSQNLFDIKLLDDDFSAIKTYYDAFYQDVIMSEKSIYSEDKVYKKILLLLYKNENDVNFIKNL